MPRPLVDLTGQKFVRLSVICLSERKGSNKQRLWECVCDCGNVRYISTSKLRRGEHVSCGCLRLERMVEYQKSKIVYIVDGKKHCPKCKQVKSVEDFSKSNEMLCGLQVNCKACVKEYRLNKEYGITTEQADSLLEKQNGKCAACGAKDGLHIDHDHLNGFVRGILCGNCNRALGLLQDNPEVIQNLLSYIRKYS